MRRRPEFLVSKRDGRREWLRVTKLARSVAAALDGGPAPGGGLAAEPDFDPHAVALELAVVVIEALRRRRQMVPFASVERDAGDRCAGGSPAGARDVDDREPWLTTADLAAAVERTLWVSGRPEAAVRYAAMRSERQRRVAVLGVDRRSPPRRTLPALRARVTFDHN